MWRKIIYIYFNLLKLPFWLDWLLSSFSWVSSPFHRRGVFLVFLTFWNRMQVWIWAMFLYGHGNRVTREGDNLHWKFFLQTIYNSNLTWDMGEWSKWCPGLFPKKKNSKFLNRRWILRLKYLLLCRSHFLRPWSVSFRWPVAKLELLCKILISRELLTFLSCQ